ncbi:hypothetical protein [Arenivirga flava]|nr:hypothetical protein [Arenivirga flava]
MGRLVAGALVLGALLATGVASPASAAVGTDVAWQQQEVAVDYGERWHAQLRIDREPPQLHESGPLPTVGRDDGTIDVYLDGGEEPWASGIPIAEDGAAYVSTPRDRDPLPAGEHALRAVLVPSEDSDLDGASTVEPLRITVASFPVTASLTSLGAPEQDSLAWDVRLELSGAWVERNGAVPAGTWKVRLLEGPQERVVETRVLDIERSAAAEAETVRFERLRDAVTYTAEAVFEPRDDIAGGLELEQPDRASHEVSGSLGAILEAPLTIPVPIVIGGGAVLLMLLLAIVAIAGLLLRLRVRTES